jgi:hypothetical protein
MNDNALQRTAACAPEEIIELLEKRGYDPRRDKVSMGQALSALLSDLVLDEA